MKAGFYAVVLIDEQNLVDGYFKFLEDKKGMPLVFSRKDSAMVAGKVFLKGNAVWDRFMVVNLQKEVK